MPNSPYRPWIAPRKYHHTPAQILEHFTIKNNQVYWKVQNKGNRNLSKPSGTLTKNGYIAINLEGKVYQGHAIAWVLYYGCWPTPGKFIDHINGIKIDNRKDNLRETTPSQNGANRQKLNTNNKSGVSGVHFDAFTKKWCVQLVHNGICICGGSYSEKRDAISQRIQLENKYRTK